MCVSFRWWISNSGSYVFSYENVFAALIWRYKPVFSTAMKLYVLTNNCRISVSPLILIYLSHFNTSLVQTTFCHVCNDEPVTVACSYLCCENISVTVFYLKCFCTLLYIFFYHVKKFKGAFLNVLECLSGYHCLHWGSDTTGAAVTSKNKNVFRQLRDTDHRVWLHLRVCAVRR